MRLIIERLDMQIIFLFLGAALTAVWGISHLIPTKNVVAGFGDISDDNRRIITMEWIVEGVSLMFVGALVAVVTFIDPDAAVSRAVYIASAAGLLSLALVSLFSGFKVKFLPFKLCPFILTVSSVLVITGTFV
jgi:hypothetical protein